MCSVVQWFLIMWLYKSVELLLVSQVKQQRLRLSMS